MTLILHIYIVRDIIKTMTFASSALATNVKYVWWSKSIKLHKNKHVLYVKNLT